MMGLPQVNSTARAAVVSLLAAVVIPAVRGGPGTDNCSGPDVPALAPLMLPQIHWLPVEWRQWRDAEISRILQPTFPSKGEMLLCMDQVVQRSAAAYAGIEGVLRAKPDLFAPTTDLGKAMGPFVAFVKAQHWMALRDAEDRRTHALGMEISDRDYYDYAIPFVELPPLLKSPEFLQKMSTPATYKDAVDQIEAANARLPVAKRWKVVPFRSQFILSVDSTTYGRMLVLIPNMPAPDGGTLDQWVLFAIATPEMDPATEILSVSVIATHRPAKAPGKVATYGLDFMRLKDAATGKITPTAVVRLPADSPHSSENCYDCHKAAVIPIHPKVEYAFAPSGALIEKPADAPSRLGAINEMIKAYGPPDFGRQQAAAYGPSLGPQNRPRSDAFIAAAAAGTGIDPASYGRIRQAMNCSSCHNDFAPINYLQATRTAQEVDSFESRQGMVQTMIESGLMPPDNRLSRQERKALWQCLSKEYLDLSAQTGVFIEWLKGPQD